MNGQLVKAVSEPENPAWWPAIGQISRDRAATIGLNGFAFLFQGSNQHYDAYFHQRSLLQAEQWAELTDERHKRFAGSAVTFVSAFVPNKASTLNEHYPFMLPYRVTPTWSALKASLVDNVGVLFLDSKRPQFAGRTWEAETLWRRVDSHWSVFGCIAAVNSILHALGVSPIDPPIVAADEVAWGDLSSRWFGSPVTERQTLTTPRTQDGLGLADPVMEFDSSEGQPPGGVTGRRVVWVNPEAPYRAHVVVVGNSFAGPGFRPEHMVWWLARLFRRVTFVHCAGIPSDIVDTLRPDAVVFQGLERFLYLVPGDSFTMAELDRINRRAAVGQNG